MRPSEFDEWSDADRGEALALIFLEESRCPCGCGQYVDEAYSREFNWDVTAMKCYAGQALDIVRRSEAKQNNGVDGWDDGLMWSVRPVPRD